MGNEKRNLTSEQEEIEDLKNDTKMTLEQKQTQEIIFLLRRMVRAMETFK